MHILFSIFFIVAVFTGIDYLKLEDMREKNLRMAELGAILIRDRNLTERQKSYIYACLNDTFNWWFMPHAILLLPVFVWKLITGQQVSLPYDFVAMDDFPEFREFKSIHINSMASTNSFFAIIFVILLVLLLTPVFLFSGLSGVLKIIETSIYKASNKIGSKSQKFG